MKILQPKGWAKPRGYSNGIEASGRIVFVAGQIGWNDRQQIVGTDFADQTRQALKNIVAVLAEAGARPADIARMTWYVTDKSEYRDSSSSIGQAYREIIGEHYPVMTLVEVKGLLEPGAKVEIEATAICPGM